MRTYLVVIDESPESAVALRFAARRAAKTGGAVQIISPIAPTEFVGLGGVQATMEEEARQHAEALAAAAASILTHEAARIGEATVHPSIMVEPGEPIAVIRRAIGANTEIAALVLGAAATGAPGPLISHFAGGEAGQLPCPVMIVPGGLDDHAIDRLS